MSKKKLRKIVKMLVNDALFAGSAEFECSELYHEKLVFKRRQSVAGDSLFGLQLDFGTGYTVLYGRNNDRKQMITQFTQILSGLMNI